MENLKRQKKTKYYERTVTHREAINRFGKIGYPKYIEYIKTDNIEKFNKGKKIWFFESDRARKFLYHLEKNKIYSEKVA